ncbi:MAG: hypothetical protein ACOY9Y_09015 [Bacillota bacterium]
MGLQLDHGQLCQVIETQNSGMRRLAGCGCPASVAHKIPENVPQEDLTPHVVRPGVNQNGGGMNHAG